MAYSVGTLSRRVKETGMDLLAAAQATTSLAQYCVMVPGIKDRETIGLLSGGITLQAGACGYSPSGTTTIGEKFLTVADVVHQETFCNKDLLQKWANAYLAPGAATELESLPWEDRIIMHKLRELQIVLNNIDINGDTGGSGNLSRYDGFLKTITAASDEILANAATGGWTALTGGAAGITNANIDEIFDRINSLIPNAVLESAVEHPIRAFVSRATWIKFQQYLRINNLFHFAPDQTVEDMLFPGTSILVTPVDNFPSDRITVAQPSRNFFVGMDGADDADQYKIWYSEDNEEIRSSIRLKRGVQVAYTSEVVDFIMGA